MNSNSPTQQVIEFLTHPELPFGTDEDRLTLEDPEAFQARVATLLDEYPQIFGEAETNGIKANLDKVAWSFVTLEFQTRIEATAGFFNTDTKDAIDSGM